MSIATSYNVGGSPPADGAALLYDLITLLTANGWNVPQWSDGTTLHSPGSSQTSNPYSSRGGSGANNLGNSNAWFRLAYGSSTSAATYREWVFQRGTSGNNYWLVSRCKTGFTAGSPNATTIPTGADPTVASVNLYAANTQIFPTAAASAGISCDTVTGCWWMWQVVATGGNVVHFSCDETFVGGSYPNTGNTPAQSVSDGDPYLAMAYGVASGGLGPAGTMYNQTSVNGGTVRLAKRHRHGQSSPSYQNGVLMILYNAGDGVTAAPGLTSSVQIGPDCVNTQEWLAPIIAGRTGATGATTGWYGILNGMRWSTLGSGRSNGQTYNDTVNQYIFVAGLWVPWDTSTPSI